MFSYSLRSFFVILLSIVLSVSPAFGVRFHEQASGRSENRHQSRWLVRPCEREESALGAAEEVVRLFPVEHPTFNWCEALEISWLPHAEILRFHTAIDVDYASTATVIKATSESPVKTVLSGEGIYSQPSPNLPSSLAAVNDLLKTATPKFTNASLKDASILYLYLLGRENRCCTFRHPEGQHPLSTSDYRTSYENHDKERIVRLTSFTGEMKLTFSLQEGVLHLVTTSE